MEKLERLQELQTSTQKMMIEIKALFPDTQDEESEPAVMLMNLKTVSKELNSSIIKEITEG